MPELTARQEEVVAAIRAYQERHGRPPTLRAFMALLSIASPNGMMCHLKALTKKGVLERDPFAACGMRLTERPEPSAEVRGGLVVLAGPRSLTGAEARTLAERLVSLADGLAG